MNTTQLEKILKGNATTKNKFGGIYNNRNLKNIYNQNKFYIVNTTANPRVMGHWILFIFYNNILYFIDSLGRTAEKYGGCIKNFFNECTIKKINLMKSQLQSNTSLVCGAYVIYFSYHICKNINPNTLVLRFNSKQRLKNDMKVEGFLYLISGTKLHCKMSLCPKHMFGKTCKKICFC